MLSYVLSISSVINSFVKRAPVLTLRLPSQFITHNNVTRYYMGLLMRKPVFALCEQQRLRSACASAKSDQHLCGSLFR